MTRRNLQDLSCRAGLPPRCRVHDAIPAPSDDPAAPCPPECPRTSQHEPAQNPAGSPDNLHRQCIGRCWPTLGSSPMRRAKNSAAATQPPWLLILLGQIVFKSQSKAETHCIRASVLLEYVRKFIRSAAQIYMLHLHLILEEVTSHQGVVCILLHPASHTQEVSDTHIHQAFLVTNAMVTPSGASTMSTVLQVVYCLVLYRSL
eukprot:scpid56136/ scgid24799/ 